LSLQLSKKFSLPKEAALWAFVVLAIRGAGKTYDAAKLAEQMMRLGIPIVVFDPMGIWWGLRVGVETTFWRELNVEDRHQVYQLSFLVENMQTFRYR